MHEEWITATDRLLAMTEKLWVGFANYYGFSDDILIAVLEYRVGSFDDGERLDSLIKTASKLRKRFDRDESMLMHGLLAMYRAQEYCQWPDRLDFGQLIEWSGELSFAIGKAEALYEASRSAAKGGNAKSLNSEKLKAKAIELHSKLNLSKFSADEAASKLIAAGVSLSHRKIADTIRKAKKLQDASHNAQDAK